MSEHSTLAEKALNLVQELHKNQKDKNGEPYVGHLTRVSARMTDDFGKAAALLHDSVEDTDYTLDDVERDFGKEMRETIDHLTHREGEEYFDYVSRAAENPTAKLVKISDLIDNSNLSRLATVTLKDVKRQAKYNRALELLMSHSGITGERK